MNVNRPQKTRNILAQVLLAVLTFGASVAYHRWLWMREQQREKRKKKPEYMAEDAEGYIAEM